MSIRATIARLAGVKASDVTIIEQTPQGVAYMVNDDPLDARFLTRTQLETKPMSNPFKQYRRTNIAEMRRYVPGEDMTHISVSEADQAEVADQKPGGMIGRNPDNHADQWYVAAAYFAKNFEKLPA